MWQSGNHYRLSCGKQTRVEAGKTFQDNIEYHFHLVISIVLSSSSNIFDTQPNSPPGAAELRGSMAPTQASLQSLASRLEAYVPGRWETP
jgi:hypothetical protein